MIRKLLFTLLTLLTLNLFAQTETITIDWDFNSIPSASGDANSSRTIEVGDTVQWNWVGTASHNVVSSSGSTEAFSSGATTSNSGINFSHTFTQVGSNSYVCEPHSSIMFGTITVVADGTLDVTTFEDALNLINIYPNPANATLNVDVPSQMKGQSSMELYNVLGRKIYSKNITELTSSISISNWNSGVYLIRISSDENGKSTTKRFVKI